MTSDCALLEQQLKRLAAEWRETAKCWERAQGYRLRPGMDITHPPEYGTIPIANWINWLRGCADKLDDAMEESRQRMSEQRTAEQERERLAKILGPRQTDNGWPWDTCPVCCATVAHRVREFHIDWHLRNLQ